MIDIEPQQLEVVKKILVQYVPKYEVWVFGSRVTGTAKQYSDLDLAIISNKPIDPLVVALLRENFSKSDLPFKVDIVDWATTSENFRKFIKKNHEIIK
ncbi:MAG: nucleotidyltransferase domain-containing protein [Gammaproteobacteria bacterium]|jgi:predicted nucleotidyltransferase